MIYQVSYYGLLAERRGLAEMRIGEEDVAFVVHGERRVAHPGDAGGALGAGEIRTVVRDDPSRRSALLRFAGGLHIVAGRVIVEAELDTGAVARRLRKEIGELYGHPATRSLGELLIDAEEDKYLRAVLVGMLREPQR